MQSEGGVVSTIKNSILILIFEMLGTFFLTLLYSSLLTFGDVIGFLFGFFILLIFSAKISGSHYNPAVTVAFMLRKEIGSFSRPLGVAYIIF